jgi:hypothetical protein
VLATAEAVQEDEAINEKEMQYVADEARITIAASPKTAPAIKATITRLYSMSLPF